MDDEDRDAPVTLRELRLLDASWSNLEISVEREHGFVGWVRRRGYAARVMIAFGVAALVPSLAGSMMIRVDSDDIRPERAIVEVLALFTVALGAAFICAWPLHRPPPPRAWVLGIAGGALVLGLVLILAPPAGGAEIGCFTTCCVSGMLALAPGWLIASAVSRRAPCASIGAATLAGASAFFALRTICADDSIGHGLGAHLMPILLATGAVMSALSSRR